MWPWIKRWRDWAMHDLWPLYRIGPQPQALHYSYEKAGLTLHDQPIPWNAEAVLVEALLRLPPSAGRRKGDFLLRLPGQRARPRRAAAPPGRATTAIGVLFRLPPPGATAAAELLCRDHVLGQLTLPFLSRDEFLQNLRLQMPTLFVRLGDRERRLPDVRLQPVPGPAGQRRAHQPDQPGAAARPGSASRVPLRARRAASAGCRLSCAARSWPAARRW